MSSGYFRTSPFGSSNQSFNQSFLGYLSTRLLRGSSSSLRDFQSSAFQSFSSSLIPPALGAQAVLQELEKGDHNTSNTARDHGGGGGGGGEEEITHAPSSSSSSGVLQDDVKPAHSSLTNGSENTSTETAPISAAAQPAEPKPESFNANYQQLLNLQELWKAGEHTAATEQLLALVPPAPRAKARLARRKNARKIARGDDDASATTDTNADAVSYDADAETEMYKSTFGDAAFAAATAKQLMRFGKHADLERMHSEAPLSPGMHEALIISRGSVSFASAVSAHWRSRHVGVRPSTDWKHYMRLIEHASWIGVRTDFQKRDPRVHPTGRPKAPLTELTVEESKRKTYILVVEAKRRMWKIYQGHKNKAQDRKSMTALEAHKMLDECEREVMWVTLNMLFDRRDKGNFLLRFPESQSKHFSTLLAEYVAIARKAKVAPRARKYVRRVAQILRIERFDPWRPSFSEEGKSNL